MLASSIISDEIPPLRITDDCAKVLQWMDEFRVSHLPVFKNGRYIGIISETEILDNGAQDACLDCFEGKLPLISVQRDQHIYDVIQVMDDHGLSLVPILDESDRFLGVVSYKEIIAAMVDTFTLTEPGSVFVLEMNEVDYALSEIARIVEANDSKVLSSHINRHHDSTLIDVTVKVNTPAIDGILQTLERYDYSVKASFQKGTYESDLEDRYDEFMRYLDI